MNRTVTRPLVLTAALLAAASASLAEPVVDAATGLRLDPPAGWERMPIPANPKAPSIAFATPEAMHDGLRSVLIINTQPNAARTEADGRALVDDTMRRVREQFSKPPTNGTFEEPQDAKLAGRPAKVISYAIQANGHTQRLKQWYAIVDGRFVSATYTGADAIFKQHAAEADAAVASVQLDAPAASQPAR